MRRPGRPNRSALLRLQSRSPQRLRAGRHRAGRHAERPAARLRDVARNTADKTTLPAILERVQKRHGQAQRIWVMDRGGPAEAALEQMRTSTPPVHYLVGTPKARLNRMDAALTERPWVEVRGQLRGKCVPQDGENRSCERLQRRSSGRIPSESGVPVEARRPPVFLSRRVRRAARATLGVSCSSNAKIPAARAWASRASPGIHAARCGNCLACDSGSRLEPVP